MGGFCGCHHCVGRHHSILPVCVHSFHFIRDCFVRSLTLRRTTNLRRRTKVPKVKKTTESIESGARAAFVDDDLLIISQIIIFLSEENKKSREHSYIDNNTLVMNHYHVRSKANQKI